MGYTIGIPSLKLNNVGQKSKHCGNFGAVAREALEERQGRDPDIDSSKSHLNIYEGIRTAAELQDYSKKHLEQLRDAQGRKLRKDAVVMCSTIIKPPAEMMLSMSREDQLRFLKDAQEKLDEIIGPENGRSTAIHFDEQGPHLHRLWEPITKDGRLCAKEMHNLQFFGRLNREMPEFLRSRGWDIDDCQAYDAALEDLEKNDERKNQRKLHGRSSAVYKRDMENRAKHLQKKVAELKEENKKLTEKKEKLIEKNEKLIERLQLIRTCEEYRIEAVEVNEELDLMEELVAGLSEVPKLFKAEAAQTWIDRTLLFLQKLRKLVEAGILRLKIFEKTHDVSERLSETVEKRAFSVDQMISAASKKAGNFSTKAKPDMQR